MAQKHCRSNEEVFDETSDDFEIVTIPKNAPVEGKSGITMKGSNDQYAKAHKVIMEIFGKKGDRFVINSNEICITDVPTNKPVSVEIKCMNSFSGKANLRMYSKNNKGISTIMITKPSGGDMVHVKNLAFKVIKYLLDGIISDEIGEKEIDQMRRKPGFIKEKLSNICEKCDETFTTRQLLSEHLRRSHETEKEFTCDLCDFRYASKTEMTKHKEEEHMDTSSPVLKKIKLNLHEDISDAVDEVGDDFDSLRGEPGYIGFQCKSGVKEDDKEDQFMQKVVDVRNEFEMMRKEFKELKLQLEAQNKKQIHGLQMEIRSLKENYKQCMEDLKNETYARLKAEETSKVLKDIVEANIKLQTQNHDTGDVMEVDIQKEVEVSNKVIVDVETRAEKVSEENYFVCDKCESIFMASDDLQDHNKTHHNEPFQCVNCDEVFETHGNLKDHSESQHSSIQIQDSTESFECLICKESFNDKESCESHKLKHNHIKCVKCDKSYQDMASLRRHDWRCHRTVKCNLCDETLSSRQDIASHREKKT